MDPRLILYVLMGYLLSKYGKDMTKRELFQDRKLLTKMQGKILTLVTSSTGKILEGMQVALHTLGSFF
jgi:hypothetical protein